MPGFGNRRVDFTLRRRGTVFGDLRFWNRMIPFTWFKTHLAGSELSFGSFKILKSNFIGDHKFWGLKTQTTAT